MERQAGLNIRMQEMAAVQVVSGSQNLDTTAV